MTTDRTFFDRASSDTGGVSYQDQSQFARFIGSRVLGKISGTADRVPADRKSLLDKPSDRYFAGQLVPEKEAGHSDLDDELQAKLNPSAIQAEFLLDPEAQNRLTVQISGNVYYRSFPTYEEQTDNNIVELADDTDRENQEHSQNSDQETFTPVYRRLTFETGRIEIEVPEMESLGRGEIRTASTTSGITDRLVTELQDRLREIETSDDNCPVWRPAEHVDRDLTVRDLPEMDPVTIETTHRGEYAFPSDLLEGDEQTARERYEALIDVMTAGDPGEIMMPPWDIEISCEFSRREAEDLDGQSTVLQGTLIVENRSDPAPDTYGYDTEYGRNDYDSTLFDVSARLELASSDFLDFTFERLERDFRYDRKIPGHGTNCIVVRPGGEPEGVLETEYLPTYRQQRFVTRDPESLEPVPDTTFETLSDLRNGGLDALEDLVSAMDWYLTEAENGYDRALADEYADDESFREEDETDFKRDRELFRREKQRCQRAVDCLRRDLEEAEESPTHTPYVARAFELMNRTFRRKVERPDGSLEYDSWRLFQLVFIMRILPDIASRSPQYDDWKAVEWRHEDNEVTEPEEGQNFNGEEMEALDLVDIVWFPTGGGKTEAYLGLGIFSAFFDRFRGKKYGISAWTRFPLRLLSLQQTQRISEVLMYAELVRQQDPLLTEQDALPFSLGYLVGSQNTPNKLTSYSDTEFPDEEDYKRTYIRYQDDEQLCEETQVIPRCPVCDSEVKLRATNDLRLAHYCTGEPEECTWQQRSVSQGATENIFASDELPVHIVDNELYRYGPTMVVGTIDKIAAVDYDRKSGHLYTGEMTHWCPDHGFASRGECTEKYGCHEDKGGENDPEARLIPLEDTSLGRPHDIAPTLQIQDELHLLEETLGTFDSHFETFIDTLQREAGEQRTKIIAATATIEEYDRQVKDLYLRKAERFPAPGPYNGENFYATTEDTTRRQFAGIMPHGKTQINAVLDLMYHHMYEVERIREELEPGNDPHPLIGELGLQAVDDNDDFRELLKLYETTLTYCISKDEKDRLVESIRGQITDYMLSDDLPTPLEQELTGDTKFNAVEEILNNLEDPPDDHRERINMIAATNMISHGVDVDRFNYMVFFGMPRQTAEYIQSSSRTGRTHPGLVLLCFNPARERDQSHYHMFRKYHAYLDRLVESVPLNRWSHFSVKRTLPGILFGWILSRWMYETNENLYFSEPVEELARSLQPNHSISDSILADLSINSRDDVVELMRRSYGADLAGDLPEAFEQKMLTELDRALGGLENIDTDMASEALNPPPLRSLRDIEEPIKIVPDDDTDKRIFRTMGRR